jgi:hypothetical protein
MIQSVPKKAVVALAAMMSIAASAGAQVIGPGTGIANEENDTAGGRINLDNRPVTLPAGNYSATVFNYDAGIAGDVTPFLAIFTGGNQYQAIAVGSLLTIAGPIQDASAPFGGSFSFSLAGPTDVYAGIANNGQNPIPLDNGTFTFTEHEGGGQPAGSYIITKGGAVAPDGSFSNPDLGRQYAFSIVVVPEAASIGLAMLGGTALLGVRRRRRA